MKKLNLGCGMDYRDGWVNADLYAKKVDVRFDFEKAPYPLLDKLFGFVYCAQVMEHLNNPEIAMSEIHRILKPGGRAEIIVPHYTSPGDWCFRHKSHFSTNAILEITTQHQTQNEVILSNPDMRFKLISATKKLRGLHIDIPSFKFDMIPIWDSIRWVIEKEGEYIGAKDFEPEKTKEKVKR